MRLEDKIKELIEENNYFKAKVAKQHHKIRNQKDEIRRLNRALIERSYTSFVQTWKKEMQKQESVTPVLHVVSSNS